MAKMLKSKYNSSGERCVDACLNYGGLRYTNEDGSPIKIEIPCDRYEEAISDFEDRIKEGLTETIMNPKEILVRGNITYNQAKSIAIEGKVRGLDFFEIDGSVECDHILGISGSVEYALAIWNGSTKEEALLKAVVRSIKIYGEDFIKELTLDEKVDKSLYIRFAKGLYSVENMIDVDLYVCKNYGIDNELYFEDLDPKEKVIKNMNLPLGVLGAFLGFILVQVPTNFGQNIENKMLYLALTITVMFIFMMIFIKGIKFAKDKYVQNSTYLIMEMFNEELEKSCYENLLTEKEYKLILKNITRGEVSKLLLDMKGSVNKKLSCNTIVTKETKFTLDARRMVVLPSEFEIIQMVSKLVGTYQDKLANDYNVNNV